jgi:excinuclease ABC subunit A
MVDQVLALPEGKPLDAAGPGGEGAQGRACQAVAGIAARRVSSVPGLMARWWNWTARPLLDLRRKHTIEVVVDRFKVRDDLGLRLAESFETALKLANGIARIAFLDEPTTG